MRTRIIALLLALLPAYSYPRGCDGQGLQDYRQAPRDEAETTERVVTGDERTELYLPLIEGKRVALFSNQTGLVGEDHRHVLDLLVEKGAKVTAVFSPEHGFRGRADAGAVVADEVDERTGIPILSLYGQNRKAFYTSLVLEFLSRVLQSSEVMFMLLLFGIDCGGGWGGLTLTYMHSILIVSFTTLFANLIGFLPMQLGVQEGGFVLSIAALGLSAALGIFVSIICRVREIIWIIVGILLMKIK